MPRRWPRRSGPGTGATERASVLSPGASAPSTSCCAHHPRPTATAPTPVLFLSYPSPSPLSLLQILQLYIPDSSRRICRFHLGFGLAPEGLGRYRVFAPFRFDDGDHLSIVLKRELLGWTFSDEGHTFMHLTYDIDENDLFSGTRQQIISDALSGFQMEDREGELILGVPNGGYGDALSSFVQGLLKIADLSYLSRERVRSVFKDDFRAFCLKSSRKSAGASIGMTLNSTRQANIRLTAASTAWRGLSTPMPCSTTPIPATQPSRYTSSVSGISISIPSPYLRTRHPAGAMFWLALVTYARVSFPAFPVTKREFPNS